MFECLGEEKATKLRAQVYMMNVFINYLRKGNRSVAKHILCVQNVSSLFLGISLHIHTPGKTCEQIFDTGGPDKNIVMKHSK